MNSDTHQGYEGWSVIEIFGHRKLGGLVKVSPLEMPGMIRVDVYTDGDEPIATQFYGPSAIFCLTPCTEQTARGLARYHEVKPVARYEMLPGPEPIKPPVFSPDTDNEYQDEDDRDHHDDF